METQKKERIRYMGNFIRKRNRISIQRSEEGKENGVNSGMCKTQLRVMEHVKWESIAVRILE